MNGSSKKLLSVNWYFLFFSTEGSKSSRMQAAVKQCVCGLEDYLHCNSLNTTISYLQPYVLYLGRIK